MQRVVLDSKQHFPDLFQVVLFEVAERAEESIVGLVVLVGFELERGELKRADQICCLGQPVVFRAAVLVHDGVGCKGVLDRVMEGFVDEQA